jgi:hypothetical protein
MAAGLKRGKVILRQRKQAKREGEKAKKRVISLSVTPFFD